MPFKKFKIIDYDFRLILFVAALTVIGIFAVSSAEPSLFKKHVIGAIAGFVIMIIVSVIDYHFILKFYWPMYVLNIALLLMVQIFGSSSNNAQRWLEIGGIRFQPSELAKILLILFFAQFIMVQKDRINSFRIISLCILLIMIPMALIVKQPDLSTTIMVALIFAVIMFSGKLKFRVILGILAVMIPAVAIFITLAMDPDMNILKDYQMNRIYAWQDPEAYKDSEAYQQLNSVTAIASGMMDGKGYKNNEITSVKNGNFLSEDQTDFIFAVIGEEFGFKGALVVIILCIVTSLECISIGRRAPDVAGSIIASSMGGLIGFQSFINIGVATLLLPNTGLPLPFVSYGLTSLMSCFIGIGVVINVRTQVKRGNLLGDIDN